MPQTTLRTFIALEIENSIKNYIQQIQDKIRETNSVKGSWVSKENIHLTLKFLGDTQLQKVESIKKSLDTVFKDINKISCNLEEIGTFPSTRFPRVLWVGIDKGKKIIADYVDRLENSLLKLHFAKEKRGFQSHITICRVKQISAPDLLASTIQEINKTFTCVDFIIDKVILFESRLTPQGSIYSPLHISNLK